MNVLGKEPDGFSTIRRTSNDPMVENKENKEEQMTIDNQITENPGVPRIESLKVENYRALKQVTLDNLTPMTVLLGPNGSGKSTFFDVFNFLSECFQYGLRHAWDRRGRGRELKSRGSDGPIVFELKYRKRPRTPILTYHLAIDDGVKGPEVVEGYWKKHSFISADERYNL